MIGRYPLALVAGILLLASFPVHAQTLLETQREAGAFREVQAFARLSDAEVGRRVDLVLDRLNARPEFVGVSVAVARGNEILIERGAGIADLEWNQPADENTVFRIGSITKQFTAAAIMKLVEEGKLNLDDPLSRFVPEFDTAGRTVTVRQLLNHTSGISDFATLEYWQRTVRLDLSQPDVLALIAAKPFDFEPGSAWRYSNTNYFLLGMIVEKLRGRPYPVVLEDEFFKPLGLAHTRYADGADIVPRRAGGYWYNAETGRRTNVGSVGSGIGGGGGMMSTAGDLLRWQIALTEGRAISPTSFEQMITSTARTGPPDSLYGFGLYIDRAGDLRRVWHGGLMNGFHGTLTWLPDVDLRVAVLSNDMQLPSKFVEEQIIGALTAETMPAAPRTTEDPRAADALRKLLSGLAAGTPDYSALVPQLADLTRPQLPRLQSMVTGWGTMTAVTFMRIDLPELHLYRVEFDGGRPMIVSIGLLPDGKIDALNFRPAPSGE